MKKVNALSLSLLLTSVMANSSFAQGLVEDCLEVNRPERLK